ncbi:MAG TPA: hypothetical protein VMF52_16215 [Steroidobacteraceae bacterium]|nr:hypothetical protein [Steroidobacteraceae bacterium]
MVLGLSLAAFTQLHVIISLIAIVTGLVAMIAFARGTWLARTTHIFIWTTVLTTVTGFLFPFNGFTPAIGTGIVSSVILAIALFALYRSKLQGGARTVYAITATIGLYLNLFVLVVQSFLKIPALHALAPNGNEPPLAAVQGVVLIASIALGFFSARKARRWAPGVQLA